MEILAAIIDDPSGQGKVILARLETLNTLSLWFEPFPVWLTVRIPLHLWRRSDILKLWYRNADF
ncbi:hypothetical protein WCLP8_2300004 [uncultured Gammaproteobacteria bacterium]